MPPIRVEVSADYGASTPVWMSGLVEDLDALGVSAALQVRLRRLSQLFEEGVIPETGWRSDQLRQEYEALQRDVTLALGHELGPEYFVTTEPWTRD